MKFLILTRGCPAVGKSTWIEQNNLEEYTVSADKLRLLFQSPITTIEGGLGISQQNDKKVWKLLYELVEARMSRGELTVVDATHSRAQAINAYRDLCKQYRYRIIVVDFTEEATLQEILERNSKRESYKFVPEDAIESIYERLKNDTVPSWAKVIKPNEFDDLRNILYSYTDKYEEVVVFGDIHSSIDPLNKYFQEYPFDEKKAYIFVGDYFDRGVCHKEVFEFLMNIKDYKNVLLLTGNHCLHLYNYVYDLPLKSSDAKETISALESAGYTKSDVRKLSDKFSQLAYFEFHGNVYCITHGGIPNIPSIFTPSNEFIKGVGRYQDSETVDKAWVSNTPDNYYSIHGHRNIFNVPIQNTERTFNLNGSPEYGETMKVLRVYFNGDSIIHEGLEFKNDTFNAELSKVAPTKASKGNTPKFTKELGITPRNNEVADLLTHRGVNVKDLGDGVYSINFDRKVFYNRSWCDITIKARGLFIDSQSNIVARSYNKFFNLNELEETKILNLKDSLKFPVVSYEKENGFLGILSVYNDEWFIASKSTNQGIFKEYFEALINPYLTDSLKDYLSQGKSMVFEVIDIANDPHIIEYSDSDVILLDVIENTFEFSKLPYDELSEVSDRFGFKCKKIHRILPDFKALSEYVDEIKQKDELKPDIEGYVLEDTEGYCFKIKEPYYNFWKKMRKFFEVFRKTYLNNNIKKQFHTANDFKVWNSILERDYKDFDKPLIEIRKDLGFQ